jgi:hypothetical protein
MTRGSRKKGGKIMEIYAKVHSDGVVDEISATPKDFFRAYPCSDDMIFNYHRFFRVNSNNELVFNTNYFRKLERDEYILMQYEDGTKALMVDKLASNGAVVVKITESEMFNIGEVSWHDLVDGKLVLNQRKKENELKRERMNLLKNLLSEEDYKIIKCSEAIVLNKEMPYDIEELVEKRDSYREEINVLQSQIVPLNHPSLN